MNLLKVGLIKKPHGIKGELKVLPLTDQPQRFKKIKKYYLQPENSQKILISTSAKITSDSVIVKFEGIDTVEEAQKFCAQYLYIDRSDGVPLADWEYYSQDLVGCRIIYSGKDYGEVVDLQNWGANDNLVVSLDGKEYFFPFLRQYIISVHIDEKKIVVNEIEGFVSP